MLRFVQHDIKNENGNALESAFLPLVALVCRLLQGQESRFPQGNRPSSGHLLPFEWSVLLKGLTSGEGEDRNAAAYSRGSSGCCIPSASRSVPQPLGDSWNWGHAGNRNGSNQNGSRGVGEARAASCNRGKPDYRSRSVRRNDPKPDQPGRRAQ